MENCLTSLLDYMREHSHGEGAFNISKQIQTGLNALGKSLCSRYAEFGRHLSFLISE